MLIVSDIFVNVCVVVVLTNGVLQGACLEWWFYMNGADQQMLRLAAMKDGLEYVIWYRNGPQVSTQWTMDQIQTMKKYVKVKMCG